MQFCAIGNGKILFETRARSRLKEGKCPVSKRKKRCEMGEKNCELNVCVRVYACVHECENFLLYAKMK